MALPATIFKCELQIADMDRGHYGDYSLTLARHPSETDERMMVRLVAFALNASDDLSFTKGLSSTDDEPDLWRKTLTGEIALWIDVGQPDDKRIRKAAGRAEQVIIYTYGGRGAAQWWERVAPALQRHANVQVVNLPSEGTRAMVALVQRTMRLQCTVQEGQVWMSDGAHTAAWELERWHGF